MDELTAGLRNRLFFRLYQAANLLHKTGTRALEAHGVTTQQWAVLGALADPRSQGGIAVGDLAALLMVSRQNLNGVLSRLEARGLTERVVDARDKRSRFIHLTEEGSALWIAIQPEIGAYYGDSVTGFSNSDLIAMLHYLESLRRNFVRIQAEQGDPEE
ncbi:transcriptional regulator [Paracoccus sanguinis]|uniref:Transcriptional regulator n=1 Tax=Paracoccus sanguinis TaxID=1545044 RepID=A0A099G957_9RHOB|nr:transcriptional regulator [Paracoccus sanguinis]KGJ19294.1 transcriptional regulator [Paracoccus sanguinis]KGJ22711.1 transcriptional regulator [Paracoccus sanguinis]